MKKRELCIFGAGGAAKDAYTIVHALGLQDEFLCFLESDHLWTARKMMDVEVRPFSSFNPREHRLVIALGSSEARRSIAESLDPAVRFYHLIHPTAILSPWVEIGEGSIIGAGCILTCDIKIGKHAYINVGTTISHDCRIGDYFTASPAVNISGNCTIGDGVFMGINSSVREKITITNDVFIGMGSIVVRDITKPGKYFGVPARRIPEFSSK